MRTVEIYADLGCPFAYVGLRRLIRERQERGVDLTLRLRAWPLELVNGTPLDPAMLGAEIEAIRGGLEPGMFAGFDPGRFPTSTVPAMGLVAVAGSRSDELGESVGMQLRTLLWEEGADIGDPEVLAPVAAEAGLTSGGDLAVVLAEGRRRVEAEWSEGVDRGVIGSPHFFVAQDDFFCPAVSVSHDDDGYHVTATPERFEAFVAAVFG